MISAQGLKRAGSDPSTAIVLLITVLGAMWSLFAAAYAPDAAMKGQSWLILGGFLTGIILLIGIVKKNAIMMIDFALEAERQQGMSPQDAIYRAALLRFRPILMTTGAMVLGSLPLAIASGAGAEMRNIMGVAVFSGMIGVTLFGLFLTPVFYVLLRSLEERARSKKDEPIGLENSIGGI